LEKKYNSKFTEKFDFDFENERTYFDFIMAQSVFTHLSGSQIENCVKNIKEVIKENGIFIFTFFEHNMPRGFFYYGSKPLITSAFLGEKFYSNLGDKYGFEVFFPNDIHVEGLNLNSQKICIYKKKQ
jgi:hypothetical protein